MKFKHLPRTLYDKWITPRLLMAQYGEVLKRNAVLKNRHAGKRCFIIGNGPSVKQQDLVMLKDEITFVVNSFWHHPDYKEIRPKYYVVVDSENFPRHESNYNAWSKDLIERNEMMASCPTTLFFNAIGKPFVEQNHLYPHNEVFYLAFQGFFRENLRFNIDINTILPNVKNVIIACIILASYMGIEEIYLLGCEHDFLAHPSTQHYKGFQHFYETKIFNLQDKDEVRYYALAAHSYERHIDNVKTLFRNYRLLAHKLAITHPHIKIFNATPESFLDVFPMVEFEKITGMT